MRAYIAHNMYDKEEIRAKLKAIEGKLVAAWKIADERVGLMRKVEEEKEAIEAEARRMAEEREVMEARHKKANEKNDRL